MSDEVEVVVDSTDAVLKLVIITIYAALLGYVIGRSMLRSEQRRERELGELHKNIFDLYDGVAELRGRLIKLEPEPEPEKPGKK